MKVKLLSRVLLFATPWTVAFQAPPSMGFSRQEYWSGLPFPPPGDLPNPGIEPGSPALQADTLPFEPPSKPWLQKIPWRRKWQPILVLLPGTFHGQRSLEGYSPWGRKESNTTEWLRFTSSKKFNVKWIDTDFLKVSVNISDFLISFLPHMHPHPRYISYLL